MLHPGYHSDGIVPESHRLPFSSGKRPNLFSAAQRPTLWTFHYYCITYSSCQQNNDRIKYIFIWKCQNPESRPQRYEKVRIFHVRVRLQDSMAALPPAKRMVATSFWTGGRKMPLASCIYMGSSPVVSTKHKKSELLPCGGWVRVLLISGIFPIKYRLEIQTA